MKKVISIIMTAVILATLALPTFAAESSFVESIKVKPAPEVVVASIVDRDNNKKEDVTADQLIITPYRPGEQSDIQKELHNVYDEIDKNGAPAIFSDEDAASVKKDGLKLDKLVVSDLFDIFYTKENTLSEDNKLNITFKTKIDLKKKSVVVMVKNNGTWTRVPAKEIKILEKYLPEQLTEEEVTDIINNVFSKVNPTSSSDMGKIMGALTPLVKGKADMGIVSKIVKEKLSNL